MGFVGAGRKKRAEEWLVVSICSALLCLVKKQRTGVGRETAAVQEEEEELQLVCLLGIKGKGRRRWCCAWIEQRERE